LREDGIPQGAGFIAALGRFLDGKDDFFFKHSVTPLIDYNPRAEIQVGNFGEQNQSKKPCSSIRMSESLERRQS
jgi:hypothetical protein